MQCMHVSYTQPWNHIGNRSGFHVMQSVNGYELFAVGDTISYEAPVDRIVCVCVWKNVCTSTRKYMHISM